MTDFKNTNASDEVQATSVEQAIAGLSVKETGVVKNPEKRRKALHEAFEARELPALQEEYPGLTRSQYKDKLFAMWKKAPENPANQVPV